MREVIILDLNDVAIKAQIQNDGMYDESFFLFMKLGV